MTKKKMNRQGDSASGASIFSRFLEKRLARKVFFIRAARVWYIKLQQSNLAGTVYVQVIHEYDLGIYCAEVTQHNKPLQVSSEQTVLLGHSHEIGARDSERHIHVVHLCTHNSGHCQKPTSVLTGPVLLYSIPPYLTQSTS